MNEEMSRFTGLAFARAVTFGAVAHAGLTPW